MLKIDSHQHFWKFDRVRDSWITDDMAVIQHDFLPEDLHPILLQNDFNGCVVVQTDQSEAENNFLLANAEKYDFIKGIVGWVNLQATDIEDRLAYYSQFEKMKGFRHVLQGESNRALMLKPEFKRGIEKLRQFGFTYDILIYPDQLRYILEFVTAFPNQPFVIDHLAKPYIKSKMIDEWKRDIEAIACHPNVYCKVSGMVTEAEWKGWRKEDFRPYLDVVFESFGIDRVMFGSDWPVCQISATYSEVVGIVGDYISKLSKDEQDLFWGLNTSSFYKLNHQL